MFDREMVNELLVWSKSPNRKPLILRGARQVGKTTAVNMFSCNFEDYIYLNLELKEERDLFEKNANFEDLLAVIFFLKNKKRNSHRTLIFIDEIQNSPRAVALLRYFFEKAPELFVVAAGSLLESLIDVHIYFPVGRVEYLYMMPLTFKEFISAVGEQEALKIIEQIPFAEYAHEKILKLFYKYAMVGGMPAAVDVYLSKKDYLAVNAVYEGLLRGYLDDVAKYAKSGQSANMLRHAIEGSFYEAGNRIRFEGFAKSNYRSREMGEALRILEQAMLLYLLYPTTSLSIPAMPDLKKSPRLHVLDTGMLNYFSGVQNEFINLKNLDNAYQGKIAEHIVGQELLAIYKCMGEKLLFWVREKKQSCAEIDYVIKFEKYLIPIEVRACESGRLRSLHEFIDRVDHCFAVRIYSGMFKVDTVQTIKGKKFYLMNLPFYLTGNIKKYLKWFTENFR